MVAASGVQCCTFKRGLGKKVGTARLWWVSCVTILARTDPFTFQTLSLSLFFTSSQFDAFVWLSRCTAILLSIKVNLAKPIYRKFSPLCLSILIFKVDVHITAFDYYGSSSRYSPWVLIILVHR